MNLILFNVCNYLEYKIMAFVSKISFGHSDRSGGISDWHKIDFSIRDT